jgi:hypothetical protein
MDASSCSIYTQLLEFQNDLSRQQLIFDDPNGSNQAYIQTLARGLGLRFEYSNITNSARITHRPPLDCQNVGSKLGSVQGDQCNLPKVFIVCKASETVFCRSQCVVLPKDALT